MNFENNIKQKLEARRITPTASAWDRIEGKLAVEKNKNKSQRKLWIGIAASFIAGISIATFIFNNDSRGLLQNQYVENTDTSVETDQKIRNPIFSQEEDDKEELSTQVAEIIEDDEEQPNAAVASNKNLKRPIIKKSSSIANVQNTVVVAQTDDVHLEQTSLKDIKLGNTKIQNSSVELSNAVAAFEANQLLDAAFREITNDKKFDTSTTNFDAHAMLLDIEAEVDPDTFKDKIFHTLKANFNKAVDAVAAKNN
ncbi:hypothetical protein [Dokdonia sp. Hel_I_53]|uniref:hypothetical protein n=1 Tax=Dokdonia sp. Hel_I_53 TaxID=1566287 RepID=UPI00119B2D3C|nr:hypothetical protein [Dokdonia sp. Hel_I_53]TVZ52012.1 hypothetical protein OD90_1175 [Dokdonia sp. Hel_I_53]